MSKIINLYGGPGTGKSTSAAYLFSLFKQDNKNVELVREYVKNWAWEGRKSGLYDQLYFLGKQIRLESLLFNKVDYIVTDSPVYLISYYTQKYGTETLKEGVNALVDAYYEQSKKDGHEHIHISLWRSKEYNPEGRYQTEAQAKDLDSEILNFLFKKINGFIQSETAFSALDKLYNLCWKN